MFPFVGNRSYDWAEFAAIHDPTWWVYWRFSEAEWQTWAEHAWAQACSQYRLAKQLALVFAGPAALGLLIVGLGNPSGLGVVGFYALFGIFWLIVLWFLYAQAPYDRAKAAYAHRRSGPREIAIGPLWRWEAGRVSPLIDRYHELTGIRLGAQADLTTVVFYLRDLASRGSGDYTVVVPVPSGQELEARQLITRFKQEILEHIRHRPPPLTAWSINPPPPSGTPPPVPGPSPAITIKFSREAIQEQAVRQATERLSAASPPAPQREETEQLG